MELWTNLLVFDYLQRFGPSNNDDLQRKVLSQIKASYKTHTDMYLNPYDGSFNEFHQEPYCCQKSFYSSLTGKLNGRNVCLLNEMTSSWVTASTVRSLHQIERLGIMSLDEQLWFALGWLAQPNKLNSDGCMKTVCYNCETGLKHGKSKRALSAYILATIIELTNCGENKRQVSYKDSGRSFWNNWNRNSFFLNSLTLLLFELWCNQISYSPWKRFYSGLTLISNRSRPLSKGSTTWRMFRSQWLWW